MQARVLVAAAALCAMAVAAGCVAEVAAPVGRELGALSYVGDRLPTFKPVTWVHAGSDLAGLRTRMAEVGDAALSQRLAAVDESSELVVTLYFDACARADPLLMRDGATITVRYARELNRTCVRAIDTLALFAVPRDALLDPTTLQVCSGSVTVTREGVTGDPIGLC